MAESIKTYLGEKVALVTSSPFSYGYGDKGWQNLKADEVDFSDEEEVDEEIIVTEKGCVYLHTPMRNKIIIESGGAKVRAYDVVMIWFFKSQSDWTPEQHEEKIQLARAGVMNFINLLDADNRLFKEFSNIGEDEIYEEFDVVATGIILSFRLVPKTNDSFCL